jgi:hypothetical protein
MSRLYGPVHRSLQDRFDTRRLADNVETREQMREETERLVKEAMEHKAIAIKRGRTRIESKCAKCGALNRVSAAQGQVRVPYTCRQCGEKQRTF